MSKDIRISDLSIFLPENLIQLKTVFNMFFFKIKVV